MTPARPNPPVPGVDLSGPATKAGGSRLWATDDAMDRRLDR